MPISKFTEKQLERLEAEIELKVYQEFQRAAGSQTGLPLLTPSQEKDFKLGNQRCSPLVWDFFEKATPNVKRQLFSKVIFSAILADSGIDRYELICSNLEPFMMGSRDDTGPKEKQAFNVFKYYKELSSEAMRYFLAHFERTEYFGFTTSAYEQWFSSLRLGLYSAPDRVLTGYGNLNYPDLKPQTRLKGFSLDGGQEEYEEYSPRLDALKSYLQNIYELRAREYY